MNLKLNRSLSWPLPKAMRVVPSQYTDGAVIIRTQDVEWRKGLPLGIVRATGRAVRLSRPLAAGWMGGVIYEVSFV